MDLAQEKILTELSKMYGFDLAVFKQQNGQDFQDKLEKYETLTYFHYNRKITDATNEFIINNLHLDPKKLYASIVYLLLQVSGDILKQVDKIDKNQADEILKNALRLINKTRGDYSERFT